VAALFTALSSRPNRATVLSTRARTSSSLRTSALMNSASASTDCSSLATAWPASSRRPEMVWSIRLGFLGPWQLCWEGPRSWALDFLVRIETFQWVTRPEAGIIFPRACS
jgi:hypothetical protein